MIDFDGFDLIFGFEMCKIVESVKLGIHTPDINFVGGGGSSEHFANLQSLDGVVLQETVLDDSEVIERPAVVGITDVEINKCLEIDNVVENGVLLFEFGQVLFVLFLDCILILILCGFVKVRLDTAVLVADLFEVKLVSLLEHIIRASLLKNVLPPSPLNLYR